jgi:hypothetical protein
MFRKLSSYRSHNVVCKLGLGLFLAFLCTPLLCTVPHIGGLTAHAQMVRSDTSRIVAGVHQDLAARQGNTVVQFVAEPMSQLLESSGSLKDAIPVIVERPSPQPTAIGALYPLPKQNVLRLHQTLGITLVATKRATSNLHLIGLPAKRFTTGFTNQSDRSAAKRIPARMTTDRLMAGQQRCITVFA